MYKLKRVFTGIIERKCRSSRQLVLALLALAFSVAFAATPRVDQRVEHLTTEQKSRVRVPPSALVLIGA
jgi:hypothetical protein